MVDYFTRENVPGKTFFACERMRATLSTTSCAAMWRKADEVNDGTHSACRICPIGAVHAGEVAASMSPLKGTPICARCHRNAMRLIGGMHCVSCYNRARELQRGCNGKGTAVVKAAHLAPRVIRFSAAGDAQALRLPLSADTEELVVAVLRDSRTKVFFAHNSAPPAAIRQARLW